MPDEPIDDKGSVDELIQYEEQENDIFEQAKDILDYLQLYNSTTTQDTKETEDEVRKETVSTLIELLCLNLPPVLEDEAIEESCTDDSDSSDDSSSSLSSEDELVTEETNSNCPSIIPSTSFERNDFSLPNPTQSSKSYSTNEIIKQKKLEDEKTWKSFIEDLKNGTVIQGEDDEDNDDNFIHQGSSSESSSEDDSSSSDESEDNSSEQIATFPYMNSDSDSEEINEINSAIPLPAVPEVEPEVITLDDDDIQVDNLKKSDMKCSRCPNSQAFIKDKQMFLVHRERHVGKSHFVCPTCCKPFVKLHFCLVHEIRVHDRKFDFDNPLISKAYEYRKEKKDSNIFSNNSETNADCCDNSTNPENNFGKTDNGIETDDDDPRFYPDYAVPSTALYAYRGPELNSMYECYEIQLKYGRKKRMNTNTISRVVLAHRQQLKEKGRISESDLGRFWKPQGSAKSVKPQKRKKVETTSESYSTSNKTSNKTPGRKKRVNQSSDNDSEISAPYNPPRRKRRKSSSQLNKRSKILNRTFVSSVISRTCQLCEFMWDTEDSLKAHRDEKHPKKKILDLMTVVTITKRKTQKFIDSDDSDDIFDKILLKVKKRKLNSNEAAVNQNGPWTKMSKEQFLASVGLLSVKKLALRKRKIGMSKVKACSVQVKKLPQKRIPRSGRVFLCHLCKFFNKSRDLVAVHIKKKHTSEGEHSYSKTKRVVKNGMAQKSGVKVQRKTAGRVMPVTSASSNDIISNSTSSLFSSQYYTTRLDLNIPVRTVVGRSILSNLPSTSTAARMKL